MPVDLTRHRMCTGLFDECHARVHSPGKMTGRSYTSVTLALVCVITMTMLPVIAAVVATEIPTESVQLWQPRGLHIGDDDDCCDDINIRVNELNTCAPFLLGNKGAHLSNGNVASFGIGEKGIRMSSWNVNHLSNKMSELKGLLQVDPRPIDVLGISETFLTEHDIDARLTIDGYHQPERRDRCGKRGGGLLAYISTALNYVRRRDLECDGIELLWIEIMPPRCVSFLVCFVYRPPKTISRIDRYIASNIENALCLGSDIYVLGDFNLDIMKVRNYSLYNDLVLLGLDQLIHEVTRPESKSCLDHIYVNNPTNVLSSSVVSMGLSDHCPVTVVRKKQQLVCKKQSPQNYSLW